MAYEEERSMQQKAQSIHLENRETLSISGVEDVNGFDETLIVLMTCLGDLCIHGEGLHIERIDLDSGLLNVRGKIAALRFEEHRSSDSLWSRLFG